MEAQKGVERAKPEVDEWSWHLGEGSLEMAGGLSKDLEGGRRGSRRLPRNLGWCQEVQPKFFW